jgi:hypothetical protein
MQFRRKASKDLFEVGSTVCKNEEDSVIIEDEKVILSLKAGTYGVPIVVKKEERGIVFLGDGDYLINSRIKTYVGTYSKQYVDYFSGWGVIIGSADKWAKAYESFKETNELPNGFETQKDFAEKAEQELYRAIEGCDPGNIEKVECFFSVNGKKGEATLHYQGGRTVFKGCNTKLVSSSEEQVVLKEGDVKLVLHGDKIVLKSKEGKLVASGDKIVSDVGVISREKIVMREFVGKGLAGKREELLESVKAEALLLVPKALEELGYRLE